MNKRTIAAIAAAVGAGPIVGMFAASNAGAATIAQWDQIAQCESGQRWNLPYGDDSSTGGLQIQDPTWRDFGGTAYAPHAYQTSKAVQIAVAERILASQGTNAWTCSRITGVILHPGGSTVPPSVSAPIDKAAPNPQHLTGLEIPPAPGNDYVVKAGDTLQGIANAHGVSLTQLFLVNRDTLDGDRDGRLDVDEAAINVGQHLFIPDKGVPANASLPAPALSVVLADGTTVSDLPSGHAAPVGATTHTVMPGDTLTQIALDHRTTVAELVQLNHIQNPNLIIVGQVLKIPGNSGSTPTEHVTPAPAGGSAPSASTGNNRYTVKSGDTLYQIAIDHGMGPFGWPKLYQANVGVIGGNPNLILPGQVLTIPS